MKLRNFVKYATIFPFLAFGMAGNAYAHRIIHVEGTLYVIICDNNGGNFTFSGSAQGATDVSGMICPTAMVGGGSTGSVATIEKATPVTQALRQKKPAGTTTHECPKGTHWYEPAKACVANGGHPD
jgi:hypothetical protein